jgi:hypothetical protein
MKERLQEKVLEGKQQQARLQQSKQLPTSTWLAEAPPLPRPPQPEPPGYYAPEYPGYGYPDRHTMPQAPYYEQVYRDQPVYADSRSGYAELPPQRMMYQQELQGLNGQVPHRYLVGSPLQGHQGTGMPHPQEFEPQTYSYSHPHNYEVEEQMMKQPHDMQYYIPPHSCNDYLTKPSNRSTSTLHKKYPMSTTIRTRYLCTHANLEWQPTDSSAAAPEEENAPE